MVKISLRLIILVIFGSIFIGNIYAQTVPNLNGTWVSVGSDSPSKEYWFNNGNFESFYDGKPEKRGTFTVNDYSMRIRFNTTHVYGLNISTELGEKWYTIEELIKLFGISEQNEITEFYQEFNNQLEFSISGNTLTTHDRSSPFVTITRIFIKK